MPTTTKSRGRRSSSSSRTKKSTSGRARAKSGLRARSKSTSRARSASRASTSRSRSMKSRGMKAKTKSRRASTRSTPTKPRSQRLRSQPSRATRAGSSRASRGQTTTDHDEIRRWVEERGGTPATVSGTERGSQEAGLLRIDFPGYSGAGSLEAIDWDDFFEKFEEANLAFLYDPDPGSKFNKFIDRQASNQS